MFFNREIETRTEHDINEWKDIYTFENGYDDDYSLKMKESTYFACIKCISEDIAKCTLEVKQKTKKGEVVATEHDLYELLSLRPNKYMSAIDCIKTFIVLSKHFGHAGLLINRDGSKIEGLYPVKLTNCTIDNVGLINSTKNNKILWDWESIEGETGSAFDKDIIILKDFTINGIKGKAVKNLLHESIDTAIKAQKYLNTMFNNGLTPKLAVQLTSDIKEERELNKIQDKFSRIYKYNGKVFTIPAGYSVSALNLSLADAQFTELRKLSKEEIAASLRVPLSKLGIKNETAKNNENDNLDFWSEALQVIMQQIEQEMDYKLLTPSERKKGYRIRFDINVLLKTDQETQAKISTDYVRNGILTINDVRRNLGKETLEYGDSIFLPSGQVTIKSLINGDVSYIKKVGDY